MFVHRIIIHAYVLSTRGHLHEHTWAFSWKHTYVRAKKKKVYIYFVTIFERWRWSFPIADFRKQNYIIRVERTRRYPIYRIISWPNCNDIDIHNIRTLRNTDDAWLQTSIGRLQNSNWMIWTVLGKLKRKVRNDHCHIDVRKNWKRNRKLFALISMIFKHAIIFLTIKWIKYILFYIITKLWIFIQIYIFMTLAEEIEFKVRDSNCQKW